MPILAIITDKVKHWRRVTCLSSVQFVSIQLSVLQNFVVLHDIYCDWRRIHIQLGVPICASLDAASALESRVSVFCCSLTRRRLVPLEIFEQLKYQSCLTRFTTNIQWISAVTVDTMSVLHCFRHIISY